MRILSALVLAFLSFLFFGCKPDGENLSSLKIEVGYDFSVDGIFQNSQGQIFCYGYRGISGGAAVVVEYDENLKKLVEHNVGQISGLNGGVFNFHYVDENQWLVSHLVEGTNSSLSIVRLDRNFKLIDRKIVLESKFPLVIEPEIRNFVPLANGDYLLALDTAIHEKDGVVSKNFKDGIRIQRYSPDLELLWEYRGKRGTPTGYWDASWINAVELDNGDIFFTNNAYITYDKKSGRSNAFGELSASGELLYQEVPIPEKTWFANNSLSKAGNKVLSQFRSENAALQNYYLIDPESRQIVNKVVLPKHNDNWGPYGPNLLPSNLSDFSGHVLLSRRTLKPYYLKVSVDGSADYAFDIPSERLERLNSARQYHTNRNTVLVGLSHVIENQQIFTLMELDREGNLLN
jgi:hypothetical protein